MLSEVTMTTLNDEGEISHFQALTSAFQAATAIGLGNIAGVAVAIQVGGPGAVFGFGLLLSFGMSHEVYFL